MIKIKAKINELETKEWISMKIKTGALKKFSILDIPLIVLMKEKWEIKQITKIRIKREHIIIHPIYVKNKEY